MRAPRSGKPRPEHGLRRAGRRRGCGSIKAVHVSPGKPRPRREGRERAARDLCRRDHPVGRPDASPRLLSKHHLHGGLPARRRPVQDHRPAAVLGLELRRLQPAERLQRPHSLQIFRTGRAAIVRRVERSRVRDGSLDPGVLPARRGHLSRDRVQQGRDEREHHPVPGHEVGNTRASTTTWRRRRSRSTATPARSSTPISRSTTPTTTSRSRTW